jgi:entericidin A
MKSQYIQLLQRLVPLVFAAALLVIAGAGAGCNTAHGFGKDVEKAGEKIQDGTK